MKTEEFTKNATGRLIPIIEDNTKLHAFVPDPIPRKMTLPTAVSKLNERAGLSLGKLSGAGKILNPWVQLFLMREAIASNAIEGTITTARELYLFGKEEDETENGKGQYGRREVLNYSSAMNRGVDLIADRPISLNLIKELHSILLLNARGQNKAPGEIRNKQNAISKKGFEEARFVPPPSSELMPLITDFENFIHEESDLPYLVRAALLHYQFEAIHPFLDGNGRLGRLLIPLLLCSWKVLPDGMPRLYLSSYLERNDALYRDRLLAISQNGEWLEWITFFLEAVTSEAERTYEKAIELTDLHDKYIAKVEHLTGCYQVIVRSLFQWPVVQLRDIVFSTGRTRQQAAKYARKLEELGILVSDKSKWRHQYFADEILRVFFEEETVTQRS